jgi:hypothetical protein
MESTLVGQVGVKRIDLDWYDIGTYEWYSYIIDFINLLSVLCACFAPFFHVHSGFR